MDNLSNFGATIFNTNDDAKLDKNIKMILSYKPFLARIFSETVKECKGMSFEEIEQCIEGTPIISAEDSDKVVGLAQENIIDPTSFIVYDLKTFLLLPSENENGEIECNLKIIVNVEAQKDGYTSYDISLRALYYGCTLITSQLGVEFKNNKADKVKYNNIKKAYSIWICTEAPKKKANTIEKYSIQREIIPEENESTGSGRYDILEAIIINLSEAHNFGNTDSEMLRLLTTTFDETIDKDEKIDILKNVYHLPVTKEFEQEVRDMTAYATNLKRKGEKIGQDKLILLIQRLQKEGRNEDAQRVISDEAYREKLLAEQKTQ